MTMSTTAPTRDGRVLGVTGGTSLEVAGCFTIPLEELAIQLSPRDPLIGNFYFRIGQVHLLQSRPDEAIPWLEKATQCRSETALPACPPRLGLWPQR